MSIFKRKGQAAIEIDKDTCVWTTTVTAAQTLELLLKSEEYDQKAISQVWKAI